MRPRRGRAGGMLRTGHSKRLKVCEQSAGNDRPRGWEQISTVRVARVDPPVTGEKSYRRSLPSSAHDLRSFAEYTGGHAPCETGFIMKFTPALRKHLVIL